MEQYSLVPKPERTAELMASVSTVLTLLSELMEPDTRRRPELAVEIAKLFAAFYLYTGDAAKSAAQVEVWGGKLGEFRLIAIRKAARWAIWGRKRCRRWPRSFPMFGSLLGSRSWAGGAHRKNG